MYYYEFFEELEEFYKAVEKYHVYFTKIDTLSKALDLPAHRIIETLDVIKHMQMQEGWCSNRHDDYMKLLDCKPAGVREEQFTSILKTFQKDLKELSKETLKETLETLKESEEPEWIASNADPIYEIQDTKDDSLKAKVYFMKNHENIYGIKIYTPLMYGIKRCVAIPSLGFKSEGKYYEKVTKKDIDEIVEYFKKNVDPRDLFLGREEY